MGDQNQPHKEVELFRAIRIRDIEERDRMHGSSPSDPLQVFINSILGRFPDAVDSWCKFGSKI
jgi:hypothetical protein